MTTPIEAFPEHSAGAAGAAEIVGAQTNFAGRGLLPRPIPLVAASAIGPHGFEPDALVDAILSEKQLASESRELAPSHPGTLAGEVPPFPPELQPGDPRAKRLMSRAAQLACIAARQVITKAGWSGACTDVGFFLGVGASGGSMDELAAMLRASVHDGAFSIERFGSAGLAAANPLFAFQLMNNFVLAHAAIREGTQGPNAAIFSRGAGTIRALVEAAWAICDGECTRAIAGGADTALHPVTYAELRRDDGGQSFRPGEGAGLVALDATSSSEVLVLDAGFGDVPAADFVLDTKRLQHVVGDAIGATPALALAAAHALVESRRAARVLVRSDRAGDDLAWALVGRAA